MPEDLFLGMKSLKLIHLGVIPDLKTLPSLAGLSKLQYYALGAPHALEVMPSLDDLTSLLTLTVAEAFHLKRLPSLAALKKLHYFNIFYRCEMCCNGFLSDGACDLTDYNCKPRVNETVVTCINDTISATELTWIKQHTLGTICPYLPFDVIDLSPTLASTDGACGGVMYRQCTIGNATGICFNTRLQVINCDTSGQYEAARRLEIARNAGTPCVPAVEAWLGCT